MLPPGRAPKHSTARVAPVRFASEELWDMDFRILGTLEVCLGDEPVRLGGPKQRALLAILLLHANEAVASDRLIDELWGDHAPASAQKALQVHVSQLRKALDPAGEVLVTSAGGYGLRVQPG